MFSAEARIGFVQEEGTANERWVQGWVERHPEISEEKGNQILRKGEKLLETATNLDQLDAIVHGLFVREEVDIRKKNYKDQGKKKKYKMEKRKASKLKTRIKKWKRNLLR